MRGPETSSERALKKKKHRMIRPVYGSQLPSVSWRDIQQEVAGREACVRARTADSIRDRLVPKRTARFMQW